MKAGPPHHPTDLHALKTSHELSLFRVSGLEPAGLPCCVDRTESDRVAFVPGYIHTLCSPPTPMRRALLDRGEIHHSALHSCDDGNVLLLFLVRLSFFSHPFSPLPYRYYTTRTGVINETKVEGGKKRPHLECYVATPYGVTTCTCGMNFLGGARLAWAKADHWSRIRIPTRPGGLNGKRVRNHHNMIIILVTSRHAYTG